jgi:hypothetical protein
LLDLILNGRDWILKGGGGVLLYKLQKWELTVQHIV